MDVKNYLLIFLVVMISINIVNAQNNTSTEAIDAINVNSSIIYKFTDSFSNIKVDITENFLFDQFLSVDENATDYDNMMNIMTAPFGYGVNLYGLWFYVFFIFISGATLYIATENAGAVGFMLIIFSAIVIIPAMTDQLIIPGPVLNLLYGIAFLGLIGVFKSLIDGWW